MNKYLEVLLETIEKQNRLSSILSRLQEARQKCEKLGRFDLIRLVDSAILDVQSKNNILTSKFLREISNL